MWEDAKVFYNIARAGLIAFILCFLGLYVNEIVFGGGIAFEKAIRAPIYFFVFNAYSFFTLLTPPLLITMWVVIYYSMFKNKYPSWLIAASIILVLENNIMRAIASLDGQGNMVMRGQAYENGFPNIKGWAAINLHPVGFMLLFGLMFLWYCYFTSRGEDNIPEAKL